MLFVFGILCSQLVLELRAAPSEIQGSPNVAVDTYRNSKGTYVLFSNGRICDAKTGAATDLGHPYAAPDAPALLAAGIGQVGGKSLGAPNVAVKAIPRPDATYILFADGKLQKPGDANAAAGGSSGTSRVVAGRWSGPGQGYSLDPMTGYPVFDEPFNSPPMIFWIGGSLNLDESGTGTEGIHGIYRAPNANGTGVCPNSNPSNVEFIAVGD